MKKPLKWAITVAGMVAVFAAVSYLPFLYFQTGGLPDSGNFLTFNMLYTLALCLVALKADEMLTGPDKAAALFLLVFLSLFGDWPVAAVLYGYGSREELLPFEPCFAAQTCEQLADFILGQGAND